ncbi:MAG: hypothetical protein KDD16_09090, partial [Mangrovimonas sp.]|nr:hypothetical protein [Mangrovimonas sp.]
KLKKSQIRTVFLEKLDIKTVAIDNRVDVENVISTILVFNELENYLSPIECSYNFFDATVSFQLELNPDKDKSDFFEAIKKFEAFIDA